MSNRKLKIYAIIMTLLFILAAITVSCLLIAENSLDQTHNNTIAAETSKSRTLAINGWNNTMKKLDYDSDIVFFGDSHTSRSDFKKFFPDKKIVNLGCPGDTLVGMQKRVESIAAVTPELVFVLGGENGLQAENIDESIEQYNQLISMISDQIPNAELVIISALPVREDSDLGFCGNDVILRFNEKLKPLAQKHNCDYVDIYHLYLDENGELDKSFTEDGVHLYPEAYDRWAEEIRSYIQLLE